MQTRRRVAIIGGGPAGLTTAYQLTKDKQIQCQVFESNTNYLGGIARSEVFHGYRCDIGGHRFFSKSKQVNDLWHEVLNNDEFIVRQRKSRIYYGRKFYDYPLRPLNALLNLGLLESLLSICSYLVALLRPVRSPTNFEQFMINRFGQRLYKHFFKSYTEKVWGRKCTDISSDWAAQRIKDFSLLAALKEAFLRTNNKSAVHATLINSFHYPKFGCGMMWEIMGEKCIAQGAEILRGKRVTQLNHKNQQWQITTNDGQIHYADQVVSSMAIKDLATVLRPLLNEDVYQVMHSFTYRDFLVVCLIVDDETPSFDDQWLYVHDSKLKVGRVQNFKSWSPHMIPNESRNLLGMEYFCNQTDNFWQRTDVELIATAKTELAALGLARQVYGGYVVRQEKAYPVYEDNYTHKLNIVRQALADTCPNLHLVGRNGMHRYNNQDHSMLSAMATAANIIAGRQVHDPWAINEDRDYLEVN